MVKLMSDMDKCKKVPELIYGDSFHGTIWYLCPHCRKGIEVYSIKVTDDDLHKCFHCGGEYYYRHERPRVVEKQKLEVAANNLELSDINISEMIADQIVRARTEATKRNIEANTILISEKLAYSELKQNGFTIPMILGMKCKYTAELPNDALFALVEFPEPPMGLKELEAENKLLREKLKDITEIIQGVGAYDL